MPTVSFILKPEKFQKVTEICELLGISKEEYVNFLFSFGVWVFAEAKKGRTVCSLDKKSGEYRELTTPHIKKLQEAHAVLEKISFLGNKTP